jgi:hypothetical protein
MLSTAEFRVGSCLLALIGFSSTALAVNPSPLQNAYWRFEEGTAFQKVSPRNADVVLDSINQNHMRAFMNETVDAAPTYTPTIPTKPLKSGLSNTLALDFLIRISTPTCVILITA